MRFKLESQLLCLKLSGSNTLKKPETFCPHTCQDIGGSPVQLPPDDDSDGPDFEQLDLCGPQIEGIKSNAYIHTYITYITYIHRYIDT